MRGLEGGGAIAYLLAMAIFPRPVSPAVAWADLRAFARERRPHRFGILALSLALTLLLMFGVYQTFNVKQEWQPPEITYVKQWPASRSDAEVRAQQAKDLPAELAEKKAIEDAARKRRQEFQRLAKRLGIS